MQENGAIALGFARDNNSFAGAEFGVKPRVWEKMGKSKAKPPQDGRDR